MDFFMSNILNIVCYLPLVGMILIMFISRENVKAVKWVANITAFLGFLVSHPSHHGVQQPAVHRQGIGIPLCL